MVDLQMRYRDLLKSYPVFKRFWIVFLIMDFGAWFSIVAIYTLLANFHASALIIATVAALHWIPGAIQAPITGAIVDKVSPKKLMIVLIFVELIATAGFLIVQSVSLIWLLMVLIFIRMSAVSFYFTAFQATLPIIVGKDEALRRANELGSLSWSLAFIVGTALGALSADRFGTNLSFMIDVVVIFIGAVILIFTDLPKKANKVTSKALDMLKDGFIYLKSNRKIMLFIALHATVGLTSFDALATLLAQHKYATIISIPLAIGAINTVRAIGLFIGPFIFRYIKDEKRLIFWLLLGQGLAIFLWAGLQSSFYISMIGVFATGLFTTTLWSATYSLLLRYTDEKMLGRIVGYNDMAFMFTNATIAVIIGTLASLNVPLAAITALIGLFFVVCALLYKRIKI